MKPFDGLDHKYIPEEYLLHIEARVNFHWDYNPQLNMNINFGTLDLWLLYNAP